MKKGQFNMESFCNVFYKVQNVSAEKNETNFTMVFKTQPEFSIKQPKKVSQHVYAIFKFWTFLIKQRKVVYKKVMYF